jgi:hypothetical protein
MESSNGDEGRIEDMLASIGKRSDPRLRSESIDGELVSVTRANRYAFSLSTTSAPCSSLPDSTRTTR